jgi:cytidylate kinase
MQIICISRGTLGGGRELAEHTAKKLGCACLSREELIEAAIKEGIQVGRLEMAMIKPRIFSEQLAIEREYYRAFCTAYLCDRALEGRLVYHGRTGHLLLPGVDHVLSVRVVADEEQRIWRVIRDLGLDRTKARKYLKEVDEDRRRWARSMYGVGWEETAHYDLVLNLQHMSVENAASSLTAVAQLPDFQMTPASQKAMADLRLAAKCRVALARHERTCRAKFKVRADGGVVTATYLPQDSRYAEFIPAALEPVDGVAEIRATMAETSILWIQERFDAASEAFQEVVELATKWNASVELLGLSPQTTGQADEPSPEPAAPEPASAGQYNGGIEDDVEDVSSDAIGVKSTLDELAAVGRSGGGKVVGGGAQDLLGSLDPSARYSLVVVGDLFLDKGHAARVRMTRELQRFVGDHVTAPVVGTDELKTQYLFGRRDVARLAGFLALIGVVYFLVFSNQTIVLKFLSGQWGGEGLLANDGPLAKVLVAAAVFVFVPIVAHCYGTVAKSLMKLVKME